MDIAVKNLVLSYETGKDDLDDSKDKSVSFLKIIEIAGILAAGMGMLAQGISQLVSSLQSIGLFR